MINSNKIVTITNKSVRFATFGKQLLLLEPILLAVMIYCFWYPIEDRFSWLPLLIGIPIFMLVRLLTYGRLFTRFPLALFLGVFIVLGLLNLYLSPFTSTSANPIGRLYLLGRPLLGISLCIYFVEYVRLYKKLDGLLIVTVILALIIGVMALLSSNWTNKSDQLQFMLDVLPRFDQFPGAGGGFNVNEIAGGLVWIIPLCAGFMGWRGTRLIDRFLRWSFILAFSTSFIALFLGQSRFAIAGTLFTLLLMVPLLIQNTPRRIIAWGVIAVFIILEVMIVRNVFTPPNQPTLAERDEESVNVRFDIWDSAITIVKKYPLTGAGMNMFRERAVRTQYPVPTFTQGVLPHTHNEFLQIATDLGLPGLLVFFSWYGVMGYGLFRAYRLGNRNLKVIAVAVAGGLLAHAFFGMGDAVTLWDRFAFVFWWLLAMGSALVWVVNNRNDNASSLEV